MCIRDRFHGKHPAGNVGIQIHHIEPITTTSKVWTLGVQDVITIGALFSEGRYNTERVVAVTGAELREPKYIRTHLGANVGELLKDNIANDHSRMVSGDVLSGKITSGEGFLNYFDDQITVIEEGDQYEMLSLIHISEPTRPY